MTNNCQSGVKETCCSSTRANTFDNFQIRLTIKKLSNIHLHEQGNLSKKIVIENCSCKLRLKYEAFWELGRRPST